MFVGGSLMMKFRIEYLGPASCTFGDLKKVHPLLGSLKIGVSQISL